MKDGSLQPRTTAAGIWVSIRWSITQQSIENNTSTLKFTATGVILRTGGLPASFFDQNGVYRQRVTAQLSETQSASFVFRVEQSSPETMTWENNEDTVTVEHESNGLKTLNVHVIDGGKIAGGTGSISDLDASATYELDAINPTAPYVQKGSATTNKFNSTMGLTLSWEATQSISNFTSTINWTLKSTGGGTSSWIESGPITVTIAGTTVLTITSRFRLYGGGAWSKTGTITIEHNTAGERSFTAAINAAISANTVNCSVNATFGLDTISGVMDINVGGTWKKGIVWINVGGTWKRSKRVWIKDGATWKVSN